MVTDSPNPGPILATPVQSAELPFARLAALGRRAVAAHRPPEQHCELCSAVIPPQHNHLLEIAHRQIGCACEACAILFADQRAARYCRIPRRIVALPHFSLTDPQWESLHLPISLAFFTHSTPAQRVLALYHSPAGATESLLALEAWNDLVAANPILTTLQPDVEALLVNRLGPTRDTYLAPIDECFKLVGLIRTHWHGLSGGLAVWQQVATFFAALRQRATVLPEDPHHVA